MTYRCTKCRHSVEVPEIGTIVMVQRRGVYRWVRDYHVLALRDYGWKVVKKMPKPVDPWKGCVMGIWKD